MYSGTLYRLNSQCKLVLYHDYRLGTARDWSINGNHGTFAANTYWSGGGVQFDRGWKSGVYWGHGYVSVPVSASRGNLSAVSSIVVGFPCYGVPYFTGQYMFDNEGAVTGGGPMFYNTNTAIAVSSHGMTSSLNTTSHLNCRSLGFSLAEGQTAKFYGNGSLLGTGTGTVSIAGVPDRPLSIGSYFTGYYQPYRTYMQAICIFNVVVSEDEMSSLHSELASW